MNWQVYTVFPEDDMMVDLVSSIGDPFTSLPSPTPSLSAHSYGDEAECGMLASGSDGDDGVVRVFIMVHEGQLSHQPLAVMPQQTVHVQCTMALYIHVHGAYSLIVTTPLSFSDSCLITMPKNNYYISLYLHYHSASPSKRHFQIGADLHTISGSI